jgi:hypothetical protein
MIRLSPMNWFRVMSMRWSRARLSLRYWLLRSLRTLLTKYSLLRKTPEKSISFKDNWAKVPCAKSSSPTTRTTNTATTTPAASSSSKTNVPSKKSKPKSPSCPCAEEKTSLNTFSPTTTKSRCLCSLSSWTEEPWPI